MAETGSFEGWTIAFDLDGTLVDTAPDLLAALNHALADAGLKPVDLPTLARLIGSGARAMMEKGFAIQDAALPASEMDAAFDRFIREYMANIAVGSRPFDGCFEALDRLLNAGATLCVCTNKQQTLSELLLDELSLKSRFAAILGATGRPTANRIRTMYSRPCARQEARRNGRCLSGIAAQMKGQPGMPDCPSCS